MSVVSRGPARSDQLLDALIAVYLAEGFMHLGVGDLAARLRCSRSSLYRIASSKEQIVVAAVRRYFQRAAERIEAHLEAQLDTGLRLQAYLDGVAEELAPASEQFYADLADYAPARDLYEENTRRAAQRVQDIIVAAVAAGTLRPVNARFVGAAVAEVMASIQAGRMEAASGVSDAEAYRALADLVYRALATD